MNASLYLFSKHEGYNPQAVYTRYTTLPTSVPDILQWCLIEETIVWQDVQAWLKRNQGCSEVLYYELHIHYRRVAYFDRDGVAFAILSNYQRVLEHDIWPMVVAARRLSRWVKQAMYDPRHRLCQRIALRYFNMLTEEQ